MFIEGVGYCAGVKAAGGIRHEWGFSQIGSCLSILLLVTSDTDRKEKYRREDFRTHGYILLIS